MSPHVAGCWRVRVHTGPTEVRERAAVAAAHPSAAAAEAGTEHVYVDLRHSERLDAADAREEAFRCVYGRSATPREYDRDTRVTREPDGRYLFAPLKRKVET